MVTQTSIKMKKSNVFLRYMISMWPPTRTYRNFLSLTFSMRLIIQTTYGILLFCFWKIFSSKLIVAIAGDPHFSPYKAPSTARLGKENDMLRLSYSFAIEVWHGCWPCMVVHLSKFKAVIWSTLFWYFCWPRVNSVAGLCFWKEIDFFDNFFLCFTQPVTVRSYSRRVIF